MWGDGDERGSYALHVAEVRGREGGCGERGVIGCVLIVCVDRVC